MGVWCLVERRDESERHAAATAFHATYDRPESLVPAFF